MNTIIFIIMLIGFLVTRHRWRRDEPGTYDLPMVFLLFYLVVEYVRPQSMYSALEVIPWGKLAMGGVLATLLLDERRRKSGAQVRMVRRQDLLMMAFVGVAGVSVMAGVNATNSMYAIVDLLKLVVLYFVLARILDTEARMSAFIWTLLILNLKLAQHHIRGFGSEVAHVGLENAFARGVNRGSGFLGNSGDFGVAMCVVLPLAFFAIWWERHRLLKWFAGLLTLIYGSAIYSTGTRGAFLGAVAIGAVVWLKMPRKITALVAGIGIGMIALTAAPEAYWQRMGTILSADENPDRNVTTRLDLWKAGVKMGLDNPVAGVGIGNFPFALPQYVDWQDWERAAAPHNMFVEALSEMGLAGLAIILFSFLAAFSRHRIVRFVRGVGHDRNPYFFYLSQGLDVALVGLAVSGSFLTVLYYPHLWLLLGLSVACTNMALSETLAAEDAGDREDREPEFALTEVR